MILKTIIEKYVMNNPLLAGIAPAHPGALLREDILPAIAKSKAEIARLLGVSRRTLYDILSERRPVTAAMALRLGKLLGNRPEMWLNMQHAYDLRAAARDLAGQLAEIPTLKAA